MAAIARNTPALLGKLDTVFRIDNLEQIANLNPIARVERLRDDLIKRYESLLSLAAVNRTDRNTTATIQYQIQVETTGLVRLIHQNGSYALANTDDRYARQKICKTSSANYRKCGSSDTSIPKATRKYSKRLARK